MLISSSSASLSFLPKPEPLLLLLPPLALLLPLLMPRSASATRLLLDVAPGRHPPGPSGSDRLLLLPALRERLSDRMLLLMSVLTRLLLSLRSLLLALPAVLGL